MSGRHESDSFTVAVLAGGASRRMGVDKATLLVDGRSLLERVVAAARDARCRCVVIGREPVTDLAGVDEWIDDEMPGEGPLAALATALRRCGGEIALVACDMPHLDAAALSWLVSLPLDDAAAGLVVRNGERLEPLFARYRRSCLPAVDAILADGRRSLSALYEVAPFVVVDAPDAIAAALTNVNTPEELGRLTRRA